MEFNIKLTEKDIEVIAIGLSKVELGLALNTFNKINNQISELMNNQLKGSEKLDE